jgi:hypothetical protein
MTTGTMTLRRASPSRRFKVNLFSHAQLSLAKASCTAMEKPTPEEEKEKSIIEDNGQTIRATRSPAPLPISLPRTASLSKASTMEPIVEDYSDLALDEDDTLLQDKVAEFKVGVSPSITICTSPLDLTTIQMRTSVRRGLFHPKDIKTIGFGDVPSAPATAPLPSAMPSPPSTAPSPASASTSSSTSMRRKSSRPSLSPIVPTPAMAGPASARSYTAPYISSHGHTRSASSGGSFGRADADARFSEFVKYAEDEDEDYDDIFGKANGTMAGQQMQTLQLTTKLSNKSWVGVHSIMCDVR